ncbi:phosphoribosylanthranilate isomerase [Desulfoplanes sp. PS50]
MTIKKEYMIQIAGVHTLEEAMVLAHAGVTHIGFPLCLDVHKEDMDAPATRSVIAHLPKNVIPVLITYLQTAAEIIALSGYLKVGFVQLHGRVSRKEVIALRSLKPDLSIIKSLIIGDRSLSEMCDLVHAYAPFVDAFLTDTYDFSTGATGATGRVHDWNISRKIVEISSLPVILAGGLTPENVRLGIDFVRPHGVDAHTGVEDDFGIKDPALVARFVEQSMVGFRSKKLQCGCT